jgi:ectoine hydroxylase-related dioxygenase (phytanoyl-CoA dioxygenase family)|tara:strand:+ start:1749 stop:2543 length:795 start_codon:yes stop_codon:yes gene_type:complete
VNINSKNEFVEKGFFMIENFFSESEIDEITKTVDEAQSSIASGGLESEQKETMRLEYFLKSDPKLYSSVIKPDLQKVVKDCLDTQEIFLYKDKYINKSPFSNAVLHPHFDGIFKSYNYRLKKETFGWRTHADKFINVAVYLSDNTVENGCMQIHKKISDDAEYLYENFVDKMKPGSAWIKEEKMKEHNIYENSFEASGKKGSIIVFDPKCIHWSGKNETSNRRLNLYLTFNDENGGDAYQVAQQDKALILQNIGQEKFEDLHKK